jgi:hypothetical protein
MNWEAIGAIGEIVGAGAVVLSIVYLAIQIRLNARATRARASFDASHSWAQFNEQMIRVPDDVLALTLKTYDPAAKIEDLTDVEYMRMVAVHRTIFQKLEGQYYLFRYGSLEPHVWENRRQVARGILDIPFYRAWWENELKNSTYSDEFVEAVEAARPRDVLGINRRPNASGGSS